LDLGCGPGQPSLLIAKTLPSAQVHATDVQAGMLANGITELYGIIIMVQRSI